VHALQEYCRQFNVPPIDVIRSHGQVTTCALPPWLLERVVENVVSKFTSDLGTILSQLGDISRKRTDSVTSVDTAPLSDDEDEDVRMDVRFNKALSEC
jgi:hypothetical protein